MQHARTFLTFSLAATAVVTPVFAATFSDVTETHRNYTAIEYVKSANIISGYGDGTYQPDTLVNRAELAKILVEATADDDTITSCINENGAPFSDVATDAWYAPYVCAAKEKGITAGYSDGTYRPTQNVAFTEAAKMITTAFDYKITTDKKVWYKPFVEQLGERGAIPGSVLAFDESVDRGELAEMIYRLKSGKTSDEKVNYNDLTLTNNDVIVEAGTTHAGTISVKEGVVTVGDGATVSGNITIIHGTLALGANTTINGNVRIVEGAITKDDSATITGKTVIGRKNEHVRGKKGGSDDATRIDPFSSLTAAEKESMKTMTDDERTAFLKEKGITMSEKTIDDSACTTSSSTTTAPLASLTTAEKESLKTMTQEERKTFFEEKGITMPTPRCGDHSKGGRGNGGSDPLASLTETEKSALQTMTEAARKAWLKAKGIFAPHESDNTTVDE